MSRLDIVPTAPAARSYTNVQVSLPPVYQSLTIVQWSRADRPPYSPQQGE